LATRRGYFLSSLDSSKKVARLEYVGGKWQLGEVVTSWRCGRMNSGPEFETELCP